MSQAEIKIDKKIPAPRRRIAGWHKYPFPDMKPGDSFFAPEANVSSLMTTANYHKKNGQKYTARAVVEKGIPGARIWRVE